jgi:hypothetical protein
MTWNNFHDVEQEAERAARLPGRQEMVRSRKAAKRRATLAQRSNGQGRVNDAAFLPAL